jgi:hypothetical protein
MPETRDRCGPAVQAAHHTTHTGRLYLCGHCTVQLMPALQAQGWTIRPIADQSPAQPAAA